MKNIAQLLTEHMAIWTAADTVKKSGRGRASGNAGSVYGVKKLRELILELAVRGKLVPQDANDEPAIELLKRIQAEKTKLGAEHKLRKEKPQASIAEVDKPFELPKKWEFVRLETISDINGGFAFKSMSYTEDGVRVIRISDFDEKGFKNDKIVRCKYSNDLEQYALVEKNILMAMTGGTVGKCYLVKELLEAMVVNQRVATIKLIPLVSPEYINCVLQTTTVQNVIQKAKNSTNDNISMLDIKEFFIPIPSLVEQQRIVAKVDELMALCDQLEQQHTNAQDAHETLVSQLLATLTQSQNAAEFNANWQRIYAYFDVLFTTEASIDVLKQTLLQLAVMGKFLPQDPNDEPAIELLKRIQAEKAKLISEGKLKKEKPLAPIGGDEKPFELPNGWEWMRLGAVLEITGGVTLGRKIVGNDLVDLSYLRVANVQRGYLILDSIKKVEIRKSELARYKLLKDDLLVTEGGDWDKVGRTAIWNDEIENCLHQNHIFRMRKFTKELSSNWVELYMNSMAKAYFQAASKQTTNLASINMTQLKSCLLAVPTQNEQLCIVAKVDALMALCDQLKTRIQQSNQQQQAIANALVAQAVA